MGNEPTRYRLYREVPGNAHMAADGTGKWVQYVDHCQRVEELEAAVKVLAKDLRSYIMDQAVFDWRQNISAEVLANPVASAAVREAKKGASDEHES